MAATFTFLILTILKFSDAHQSQDYCNIKTCEDPSIHTMCLYKTDKPQCTAYGTPGLTEEEQGAIVKEHNKLRQLVASGGEIRGNPGPQPPAADMQDLVWDDELAVVAQRNADTCKFEHDKCRDVDRFQVGQNIAIKGSTEDGFIANMTELVQMWYDEVKLFDKNQVSQFSSNPGTGHYTQLVWAKSQFLGCGRVNYNDGEFNQNLLVCNYGPAGNVIGEPVYTIGAPGSKPTSGSKTQPESGTEIPSETEQRSQSDIGSNTPSSTQTSLKVNPPLGSPTEEVSDYDNEIF